MWCQADQCSEGCGGWSGQGPGCQLPWKLEVSWVRTHHPVWNHPFAEAEQFPQWFSERAWHQHVIELSLQTRAGHGMTEWEPNIGCGRRPFEEHNFSLQTRTWVVSDPTRSKRLAHKGSYDTSWQQTQLQGLLSPTESNAFQQRREFEKHMQLVDPVHSPPFHYISLCVLNHYIQCTLWVTWFEYRHTLHDDSVRMFVGYLPESTRYKVAIVWQMALLRKNCVLQ